jgi:hypothetical protein
MKELVGKRVNKRLILFEYVTPLKLYVVSSIYEPKRECTLEVPLCPDTEFSETLED